MNDSTSAHWSALFLTVLVIAAASGLILAASRDPLMYTSALFLPLAVLLGAEVKGPHGV